MLTRRAATTLLAGVAAAPWNARADNAHSGALFYDAVGPTLTSWQVDIGNAALTRQASVAAPALIQYGLATSDKAHPLRRLQQLRSVRQA